MSIHVIDLNRLAGPPTISILICHLKPRSASLGLIIDQIQEQAKDKSVQILIDDHDTDKTGTKRNRLLERAEGRGVSHFDDDDVMGENYVQIGIEGILQGFDCCGLLGLYSSDGSKPEVFEHSIKYKEYKTNPEGSPVRYERFPNHCNFIASHIAKQFKFPDITISEDTAYATIIHKSSLIKTEFPVNEVIYHYNHTSKK